MRTPNFTEPNYFLAFFYIEIAVHGYRPRRSGLAGFGTAKPAQSAPGSTTAIDDLSVIISSYFIEIVSNILYDFALIITPLFFLYFIF